MLTCVCGGVWVTCRHVRHDFSGIGLQERALALRESEYWNIGVCPVLFCLYVVCRALPQH
jgi:hypothetical protein